MQITYFDTKLSITCSSSFERRGLVEEFLDWGNIPSTLKVYFTDSLPGSMKNSVPEEVKV